MAGGSARARDILLGVFIGVAVAGTVAVLTQTPNAEPLTLELPTPQSTATIGPTTTPTTVPNVMVFVSGAVAQPGVYELPPGSRVVDALTVAGGPTSDAATEALNQATPLRDGMQIYMPRQGEAAPPVPLVSSEMGTGEEISAPPVPTGPVRLNSATVADLETLPGIGPSLAERIIEYRNEHGPFTAIEQLSEVRGIGDAIMAEIADLIVLD